MATEWRWTQHTRTVPSGNAGYDIVVDYDSGGTTGEQKPPEFERFEALAGKLVAVSKDELDKKRSKGLGAAC